MDTVLQLSLPSSCVDPSNGTLLANASLANASFANADAPQECEVDFTLDLNVGIRANWVLGEKLALEVPC